VDEGFSGFKPGYSKTLTRIFSSFQLCFDSSIATQKTCAIKNRVTGIKLVRILPAVSTCFFDLGLSAIGDPKIKSYLLGEKNL
jgi:hypothetical protein